MKYPLFKVFMDDRAPEYVTKVLKSGFIGQGQAVDLFEGEFKAFIGSDRDLITVNSATSALDLAYYMCGVDHESEVISTPITCFSAGASVKLADGGSMPIGKIVKDKLNVEVLSYNLETKALEPKRVIGWVKLPSKGVEWFKLYCKNGRTSTSEVGEHHTWVTGDHKIYTTRGYVRVDELTDTDKVLTSYTVPNAKQMEVINGTLLGDSSINGFAEFDPELWNLGTAVVGTDDVVAERGYPPPHEDPAAVYCLEVEDNHNFVVANMVVSNCTATNSPPITRGATIVWADVNPETGLIDEDSVGELITEKTKCIVAVNWGGRKPDYNKLKAHGLPVIEDAAHGPYKLDGNNGDYVVWSFQAIKFLTCGDGGALLCPDPERARLLRWFGLNRRSGKDFRSEQLIEEVGFKYHMNDINATIGHWNLQTVSSLMFIQKSNAQLYDQLLKTVPRPSFDLRSPYWIYTIFTGRDIIPYLAKHEIQASPVHTRNDIHPAFRRQSRNCDRPNVVAYDNKQVNIPVGWWLSPPDIRHIAKVVLDYHEIRSAGEYR